MTAAGTVTIFDKGMQVPVGINGVRIGFGTSKRDDSVAWAEIEIFRLAAREDGQHPGYIVHRTGCSLKYHRLDTSCRTRERKQKGHPALLDDLPDEAVPCEMCNPEEPEYLPETDGPVARYEFPRHAFDECQTPGQVVERLTVIRHRNGTRSVQFSQPVVDALEQAADNDEGFEQFRPSAVMF